MSKPGRVLFELPIAATNGKVVCTEPASQVYLVTFSSPPDNRLLTDFCQTLLLAFDIIETRFKPGVVITTSGIEKFYSNGLDLGHANATEGFWKDSLYPLWRRIITYPGPTIALINGHAFAGALMVAMMHDYRIMNPHKGFLCLNEIDLGAPLRPPMMSVFRQKVGAQTFRRLVLEGARFKALDALKEGIVDSLGGLDDTLKYIEELKLVGKAQPGLSGMSVYRQLKQEMWRETISKLENFDAEPAYLEQLGQQTEKELAVSAKKAEEWSKASGNEKAKL